MFKAPRDKLSCILNCCKVINNLLLNASIVSNDNPPGADEFLPVLIYVTIKVWLIAFAYTDSWLVIFCYDGCLHKRSICCQQYCFYFQWCAGWRKICPFFTCIHGQSFSMPIWQFSRISLTLIYVGGHTIYDLSHMRCPLVCPTLGALCSLALLLTPLSLQSVQL